MNAVRNNFFKTSHFRNKIALFGAMTMLVACESGEVEYVDRPVDDLYMMARAYLKEGSYTKAAEVFADVERQHPYSNWALRAQIMSAYCLYQAKKYDDAIDGFKTFIQLHPGHNDVAYAYYMIGLCFYEQIPIVQRDQEPAEKASESFSEVSNRFPTSIYAKDAIFKMDLIKDHLAGKEMDVGRFYQKRGSYISALNRYKGVVDKYATTSQSPEAIYRMVECYLILGLKDEAVAAASVLGYNHKESQWYKDAYELLKMPFPLINAKKPQENISDTNKQSQEELNKAQKKDQDAAENPYVVDKFGGVDPND